MKTAFRTPYHLLHGRTLGRDQPLGVVYVARFQGLPLPIPPFHEPPNTEGHLRVRFAIPRSRPASTRESSRTAKGAPRVKRAYCRLPVRQRRKPARSLSGRLPSVQKRAKPPHPLGATPSIGGPQNPGGSFGLRSRIRCDDASACKKHDGNIGRSFQLKTGR